MLPDAEPEFVRHADAGLLQRKDDLASMMRLVRDEVPEQDEAGAAFDSFALFDDSGEAKLDGARRGVKRGDQLSAGRLSSGFEARHVLH